MTKTILVLAANPKNTPRLRLDQEVREIDNGLQRARRRDEFILKQVWAVRRSDFRRAMLDLKPNIVHFCGHGSGEDGIAFEDENGLAKLISTEALSGFFELFADTVECVVLNACYSEVQAEAIAKHIPYVIGMNKAIGDTAAIEFAVAFYDALGAGESFEFAYKLACNAIQLAGTPENLTPTLKPKSHPSQTYTASMASGPSIYHSDSGIYYYGAYRALTFTEKDRGRILKITVDSKSRPVCWVELWRGIYEGGDPIEWTRRRVHITRSGNQPHPNPSLTWRIEPGGYTIYFVASNRTGKASSEAISYQIEVN
jgi:hypothetical protein